MLTFLNAALLAGFAALAVPPIVHLFSRRKYDQIDWAAMQFLTVSPKTRRKVVFEQVLLMLLRTAALAAVVLALAGPTLTSSWLNWFAGGRGQRDVVVLIDGSASMAYKHDGRTAADAAKGWAGDFLNSLLPGDRAAVFQARQQPVPLLGTLSADTDQAKNALDLLTAPRGGVDWPGCVSAAVGLLEPSPVDRERDVVVITDGQRYGWADEGTLAKWELVAGGKPAGVRVWVVNVAADRPGDPANGSLDPITAGRGVASAGREVRFRSAVRFSGKGDHKPPSKLKLDIDGRTVGDVPVGPAAADGLLPVQFNRSFTAGSHLVTLSMEPDALPGDNWQDFALEVLPAVPVLIVDGDTSGSLRTRGGDLLRNALAPAKDPTPSFLVKRMQVPEFTAEALSADVKPDAPGTSPRVVVFSNVAQLTKSQNEAVEKYLADGGSVLFAVGDRCDAAALNRVAFRAGQGWLPARLAEAVGAEEALDKAPKPLISTFTHPSVELFKEPLPGGLHTAYFPKRWKLDTAAGVNGSTGVTAAALTDGDPLLVERGVGRGRAMISAVPLDNTWRTNLHTLPDFVRFAHELAYYLAGARAAERNLAPGQPIVFRPRPDEPPGGVTVQPPDGPTRVVQAKSWPLVIDATRDPGAYRLSTAGGRAFFYAVRADPNESVLTPCSDEDRKRVAAAVKGLKYIKDPGDIDASRDDGPATREVWPAALMVLVGLLLAEVLYARRLSAKGLPAA